MTARVNLLDLDRSGLTTFFNELGEKPYRAVQVLKWLHAYGTSDFEQMTNLSKALRQKLHDVAEITLPEIAHQHISQDGTYKWVLRLRDGNCIETVFIPEVRRGTLCISSQVGCALNCDFCSTGKQGFNRNLSTAEIIGQVWLAVRALSQTPPHHDHTITNVVFMGMGEPLLNYASVLPALRILLDDDAYGLAKRRVTISTSGIVPQMYQLIEDIDVALAVSLHAATDALRDRIVPVNKKYPLAELIPVCKTYAKAKRKVTFEYVMLAGVNDRKEDAEDLIQLLGAFAAQCKMNLIPFNPFPHAPYQCSDLETITAFKTRLQNAGILTTVRKTRGQDVDGACGQLVGKVQDRSHRQQQWSRIRMAQT